MRRATLFLLLFTLVISLFSCATAPQKGAVEDARTTDDAIYQLAVLHTNDTHGHPLKFFHYPAPDVGGLPARATLVQQVRSEFQNVLVLDAGDLNTGRPESNFFKAEPDIIGYNSVGYDAMVLGNHEFDHPKEVLREQMKQADFPFISANVKTAKRKYLTKPYIIKKFEGFTAAIFGLTTKETEIIGNPEYVKGLIIEDEVEAAKELVPILRKKADVVIALVHMGLYEDNEKGSKRLAKYVEGIDLIIDGHSHTKIEEPVYVNDTPIVQAWQWGLYVGRGVLTIQKREVVDFQWEPVPVNLKNRVKKPDGTAEYTFIDEEIEEDEELLALLEPYAQKVESILSEVIGTAEATFFNTDVRKTETALGDLVADAMLWYVKDLEVDFAVQNGGGIRADLPEGEIAKKLIYEILPFDNSVVVLTMRGSDVEALFDYIATIPQGKGAFAQVSEGVRFTINYDTQKCENILINGAPIDPDKLYKIGTNSYLASGGDGYKVFLNAVDSYDASIFQRDVVIEYIQHLGGRIKPEVKSRIELIGKNIAMILKPAA